MFEDLKSTLSSTLRYENGTTMSTIIGLFLSIEGDSKTKQEESFKKTIISWGQEGADFRKIGGEGVTPSKTFQF